MKLDNIFGKILALTKQIHLRKPPQDSARLQKFLTGNSPFILGSISLEWWLTKCADSICEQISDMAISFDQSLQSGDRESFCKIIEGVFQENSVNEELFDTNCIFFQARQTLFDSILDSNKKEFAAKFWNKLHIAFKNSMLNWLVLYPLHRIKAPSVVLEFDNLSLLDSNDIHRWEELSKAYNGAKYWQPQFGTWLPEINRDSFTDLLLAPTWLAPTWLAPTWLVCAPTWLVCEVFGTALGARDLAGSQMRTFLAVLFSYLKNEVPALLIKSSAEKCSNSIQFSNQGSVYANIGNLLPPLIETVEISRDTILQVRDWYAKLSSTSIEKAERAKTASHFIHYGIVFDNLERFLHFFIALDALFGERQGVEKNIISGIRQTFADDSRWVECTKKLFDLRSELVHGGCSSITNWKELDSYRQRFQSHPLVDVGNAAMTALQSYLCFEKLKTEDASVTNYDRVLNQLQNLTPTEQGQLMAELTKLIGI